MASITEASRFPDFSLQPREDLSKFKDRRFIIHMDVNQTIVFHDAAQKRNASGVAVVGLAKSCEAVWGAAARKKSFFCYVNEDLYPAPAQRPLRKTAYENFLEHLRKTGHSFYASAVETHQRAMELLERQSTLVLPAFYDMVKHLDELGIRYCVAFRSFGKDLPQVAKEVAAVTSKTFFMPVYFREHALHFHAKEAFNLMQPHEEPMSIYSLFRRSTEFFTVQDSFAEWRDGQEASAFGKKFYVNPEDRRVVSVFFDDNIEPPGSARNIVAPIHAKTGQALALGPLLEAGNLVPVKPLEPLFNVNYFINALAQAAKKA